MSLFDKLVEAFLTEAAALTKGSQRVMSDKKLVAGLADAMRDDARSHPASFPPNSSRSFQKSSDEDLAQWFLENIDKIEKEGYEGTIYSRDGIYSDWIARRYIAGSHNWEDLTGVMNMNIRDWNLLKNRNMLDPNHKDLPKFNSVRDLGSYMTTHYGDKLEQIRDAAKNAARNKMAKNIKLVDNDDYRIYTTLNRAAGCALGLGTQWCTANSNYPGHFHTYSNRAMLFQMFPYQKEEKDGKRVSSTDEDGKKMLSGTEKYQFDGGGPVFMDATDTPAKPQEIAAKYPYLYTDLAKALKDNKAKMEQAFKDLSADPTLQGDDFKIKTYDIDKEIEKLGKFMSKGYFTDEVRPKEKPPAAPAGEQPALPPPSGEAPPEQGEPQMESITRLAHLMLRENDYEENDAKIAAVAKKTIEQWIMKEYGSDPSMYDEFAVDLADEIWPDYDTYGVDIQNGKLTFNEPAVRAYIEDQIKRYGDGGAIDEDDEMDPGVVPPSAAGAGDEQAATGGSMGGGAGPSGGGQYPPGTAPTMPESVVNEISNAPKSPMTPIARWYSVHGNQLVLISSICKFAGLSKDAPLYFDDADLVYEGDTVLPGALVNPAYTIQDAVDAIKQHVNNQGNNIMENVDKDVAAMLASLKKYDTLKESVAPVLGMKSLGSPKQINELSQGALKDYKNAARDDGRMGMIKGDKDKMDKRAAGMSAADKRIKETEELDEKKKEEKKSGKPEWLQDAEEKAEGKKTGKDSGFKAKKSKSDEKLDEEKDAECKVCHQTPCDCEDEKMNEGADADVLTWMKRFASLGNMKGYGR